MSRRCQHSNIAHWTCPEDSYTVTRLEAGEFYSVPALFGEASARVRSREAEEITHRRENIS